MCSLASAAQRTDGIASAGQACMQQRANHAKDADHCSYVAQRSVLTSTPRYLHYPTAPYRTGGRGPPACARATKQPRVRMQANGAPGRVPVQMVGSGASGLNRRKCGRAPEAFIAHGIVPRVPAGRRRRRRRRRRRQSPGQRVGRVHVWQGCGRAECARGHYLGRGRMCRVPEPRCNNG